MFFYERLGNDSFLSIFRTWVEKLIKKKEKEQRKCQMLFISDRDLRVNKYSLAELTANVSHLNKKLLLLTQILDEKFCAEYIFDGRMNSGDEDAYLFCEDYIMFRQPHLNEKLLLELCHPKYESP